MRYLCIQLMLNFLKVILLVLHFFYYRLLSILLTLFSTPTVRRHLICGNNQSWLLNLNLTYETLDWGSNWFCGSDAGKTRLVSFD